VYVAIASYCEKRHAYRDRCEIRHRSNKTKKKKNNNDQQNTSNQVVGYLNGGTGDDDDDDDELTVDPTGFDGVIG
jgi:hypothetical protein